MNDAHDSQRPPEGGGDAAPADAGHGDGASDRGSGSADRHAGASPGPPAAPPERGARMIAVMSAIGLIAGALIVLTYQATLPTIQRNKARALERAIFAVVPGAAEHAPFTVRGDSLAVGEGSPGEQTVHACYGDDGRLVGVAIEAAGQGFQDVVRFLYGYDPERGVVVGLKVLESKETPGLGDKIGKDPAFLANFDSLAAAVESGALAHPPELVKHGQKTRPWQVEAITGATISSRAVTRILRENLERVAPVLARHLDRLRRHPS